ncbi:MAG: Verru_Chthon cassette protein A, partial [Verrucomicrobiota bacterium]
MSRSFKNFKKLRREKGVALIMVLSVLVLLTGLILSFFTMVMSEADVSGKRLHQAETERLADSAVQFVIGQIRQATTRSMNRDTTLNASADPNAKFIWASQPGAIRSYDQSGNEIVFKLYSSDSMITNNPSFANDIPPGDFRFDGDGDGNPDTDYSAMWADLNSPVEDANGNMVFPIADPAAAAGLAPVDGFTINTGTAANGTNVASSDDRRLPMPVRWLYLTRRSAHHGVGGNNQITLSHNYPSGQSKDDLLVGRIAFWTDDETSKVNINTASKGTYTGMPVDYTQQDFDLAWRQAARNEVQRFPGHPATVNLDSVFTTLTPDQIFNITPRVARGGSDLGQQPTLSSSVISYDGHRLYASVDELAYDPNRASQGGISAGLLEQTRFFLTANSRAPEVNLFGQPRIALWPVSNTAAGDAKRSTFDDLIEFCSTIGNSSGTGSGSVYRYALRRSSNTATNELNSISRNATLYSYVQNMMNTNIPGFTNNFNSKFGTDTDQIVTQIFDYIRSSVNLHDSSLDPNQQFTTYMAPESSDFSGVPGHGQVVPSIEGNTKGFGRVVTVSEVALHFICTADTGDGTTRYGFRDSWTPSNSPITGGMNPSPLGRHNLTIPDLDTSLPMADIENPVATVGAYKRRIEAAIHVELFSPSMGMIPLGHDVTVRVTGLDNLSLQDSASNPLDLKFPADASTSIQYMDGYGGFAGYHSYNALMRWRNTNRAAWGPTYGKVVNRSDDNTVRGMLNQDAGDSHIPTPNIDNSFPFVSDFVTVDYSANPTSPEMRLNGGTITIELITGGQVIQTLNVTFDSEDIPVPALHADDKFWTFAFNGISGGANDYSGRLSGSVFPRGGAPNPNPATTIQLVDVVRSVLPLHGDYRLIAAKQTVPASDFSPVPDYDDSNVNLAHRLTNAILVDA